MSLDHIKLVAKLAKVCPLMMMINCPLMRMMITLP
jgi:hypothetical protein